MPSRWYDRIKETTTTTGTGDITLAGAVSQFKTFASRYAVGEPFGYAIVGQTGTEWETGWGTLSGSTTLVRTTVHESSNSDAAVSFSAGTKDVFVTVGAQRFNDYDTTGRIRAAISGWSMP